eukprot:2619626-Amphidinium_carterae.1
MAAHRGEDLGRVDDLWSLDDKRKQTETICPFPCRRAKAKVPLPKSLHGKLPARLMRSSHALSMIYSLVEMVAGWLPWDGIYTRKLQGAAKDLGCRFMQPF